jgi:hypothetical protein
MVAWPDGGATPRDARPIRIDIGIIVDNGKAWARVIVPVNRSDTPMITERIRDGRLLRGFTAQDNARAKDAPPQVPAKLVNRRWIGTPAYCLRK